MGSTYGEQREYTQKLLEDIKAYGEEYREIYCVDTIFIGGGTPSIIDSKLIEKMVKEIYSCFNVSEETEITIEANPKTLSEAKLQHYLESGINRLSIGLQSLDDGMLKNIGRIHTAEDFLKNFRMARDTGFDNINIDLMFGMPEHTMKSWTDTVKRIIEMNPEHISFYSLQLEEGTPFYEMYRSGKINLVDNVLERSMYHKCVENFTKAGYRHYEISNCAKPGFECRHNLKYWHFKEYLGIGANASSFMNGTRFKEGPKPEYHENDFSDNVGEYCFTALRTSDGIDFEDFRKTFGKDVKEVFSDRWHELERFEDRRLLLITPKNIELTTAGIDLSNDIMEVFV